ncbi:MAG: hypothetical protein HXY20_05135 [Acidobacteria bacterium]|nr:hypothetical protein [Acidobacteriota bacterium]
MTKRTRAIRFPRVYLAIDNCFASKRWTLPREWMSAVRDLGVACVEASADTEADPLYAGSAYLGRWRREVTACQASTGVRVVNLYSGHGTYTTLGLTHTDASVRKRMLERWLRPMILTAGRIGAGIGFYCHAFPHSALQDPAVYTELEDHLYDALAGVARFASSKGVPSIGIEQMYTPHQIPWTLEGSRRLLKEVFRRGGAPFYVTIDTGHQTGQRRFQRPDRRRLEQQLRRKTPAHPGLWLGSDRAYDIFERIKAGRFQTPDRGLDLLIAEMDRVPHMFASPADSDTYEWLRELGCFSPIIHLQQVAGAVSAHQPFTEELNRAGSIHAGRVLRALKTSYLQDADETLPPRCDVLYLTLEIFAPAAVIPHELLRQIRESVQYWRRFVPDDGRPLDELVE